VVQFLLLELGRGEGLLLFLSLKSFLILWGVLSVLSLELGGTMIFVNLFRGGATILIIQVRGCYDFCYSS